jgi:hypothetical protein
MQRVDRRQVLEVNEVEGQIQLLQLFTLLQALHLHSKTMPLKLPTLLST